MWGRKNIQGQVRAALIAHQNDVWRFALGLSGKRDVADDLMQATALRALEKSHTLSHTDNLRAWLLTLCRSIWLNELRAAHLRRAEALSDVEHFVPGTQKDAPEANIFATEVLNQVMGLPEAQREAVMLVYVLGHSYRETADLLHVPIGTIMSRLAAARAKLAPLNETAAPGAKGRT
ncbi:RNA polymerase sigma factor [Roseobacteraceae bacterium S113]